MTNTLFPSYREYLASGNHACRFRRSEVFYPGDQFVEHFNFNHR